MIFHLYLFLLFNRTSPQACCAFSTKHIGFACECVLKVFIIHFTMSVYSQLYTLVITFDSVSELADCLYGCVQCVVCIWYLV